MVEEHEELVLHKFVLTKEYLEERQNEYVYHMLFQLFLDFYLGEEIIIDEYEESISDNPIIVYNYNKLEETTNG